MTDELFIEDLILKTNGCTMQQTICQVEDYATPKHRPSPSEIFDFLAMMKDAVNSSNENAKRQLKRQSMADAIWGSNNIESQGLRTKSDTVSLCIQFWEPVEKQGMKNSSKQSKKLYTDEHIATLQHAQAFEHAYQHLVIERKSLDLELLLAIHAILLRDDVENLPGHIRNGPCYGFGDNNFEFVDSERLPVEVERLIALWNSYQSMVVLDPYIAAAEFSIDYIAVHPMFDGNGRMSRILMNCLLLQYGPFCSALGSDMAARKRYLNCMAIGVQQKSGSAPLAYEILYATYQQALDCQSLKLMP